MLNKRLRIYRPFAVREYGSNKKYSDGVIIFERTNTTKCFYCKWNEYFLQCSRYKLTFKCGKDCLYSKYYDIELHTMCIDLKNYVLKSIKI